jgi:hypothetical protein
MGVDYFHRLIVSGPPKRVDDLRRSLVRTSSRRVGRRAFSERVPFSFAALYELAPDARRVERDVPGEPYDVRAWPVASVSSRKVELRYQLHTRDRELSGFLRPLSRACPALTFRLVTLYLDDGELQSFLIERGRIREWWLPARRHEAHWDRARKKFRLTGDEVYDDDEATLFAEDGMSDEALDHWDPATAPGGRKRPREWWNRPIAREFSEEQELDFLEISEQLLGEGSDAASISKVPRKPGRVRRRTKVRPRKRAGTDQAWGIRARVVSESVSWFQALRSRPSSRTANIGRMTGPVRLLKYRRRRVSNRTRR